ncbi:hypothetical protein C0Q70_12888 [Pomacea canaliculata]|uniref:Uncharacterized protein n=1 Tax=Pomacea canaliculata TaxID=400727 RepID=A0A2T7P2R2_POMCA|nr:hypothetical protein C0Q70_12888 [Pomacea canaliculata]
MHTFRTLIPTPFSSGSTDKPSGRRRSFERDLAEKSKVLRTPGRATPSVQQSLRQGIETKKDKSTEKRYSGDKERKGKRTGKDRQRDGKSQTRNGQREETIRKRETRMGRQRDRKRYKEMDTNRQRDIMSVREKQSDRQRETGRDKIGKREFLHLNS